MPELVVPEAAFATAQFILQQTALEIGLNLGTADPFQQGTPITNRLCALLTSTCNLLKGMHEWQHLQVVYNLTTQAGDTGVYPLPSDFYALTDQTGWQKSYFWPLRGPYSAQMWQRVVNYPTTGIYVAFRIENNQIWLWPQPPPIGIGVTFVYKSNFWCTDGLTNTGKAAPTQGSDTINFDWMAVMTFLKLRYLASLGHDVTAAKEEFRVAMDMAMAAADGAAPELELARDARFPFITGFNSPDTGFGGQPPAGGSYQ
jgi:hypothetical protein